MINIDYNSIGLEKEMLYEVLVTTISINKTFHIIPNTASMGIRINQDDFVSITPFPQTKTYQNIKSIPIAIISFVDDVFLFILASLKELKISNTPKQELQYDFLKLRFSNIIQEFISNFYSEQPLSIPYIKNSWAVMVCELKKEQSVERVDQFGKVNLTEFLMNPIYLEKFRDSFKLYNRAENLILEIIILATRLKVASELKDNNLLRRILKNMDDLVIVINKFNKNEGISRTLKVISQNMEKYKL